MIIRISNLTPGEFEKATAIIEDFGLSFNCHIASPEARGRLDGFVIEDLIDAQVLLDELCAAFPEDELSMNPDDYPLSLNEQHEQAHKFDRER